jgi:cytochrome P450
VDNKKLNSRVLFNIRLKTQVAQNDMAVSLAKLIKLLDQNNIIGEYRVLNPIFHIKQYLAQRSLLAISSLMSRKLDNAIREQVNLHRKTAAETRWKSGKGDILDLALNDPDYGKQATTSEIVDQMKTFFFAGNDTTSAILSWIYVFLFYTPRVLVKLRKELDEVFGPEIEPKIIAEKILQNPKILGKLDYTLAVARETLRLEPPAQMIRSPPTPYTVTMRSGNTYLIEPGTMILINSYQMARNKSVWGEDAAEFNPDRFMRGSIPPAFMTFSKRPRDCIGTNLAYLEVLSHIIFFSCF